jgi:hypothetical protein
MLSPDNESMFALLCCGGESRTRFGRGEVEVEDCVSGGVEKLRVRWRGVVNYYNPERMN